MPRSLRLRRDFTAPRELVWGCDGRRFAARTVEDFNGRPAYHVYTAWELGGEATHREVVRTRCPAVAGVQRFGRIDARRQQRPGAPGDLRAPFEWQRACDAEALELIRDLCPETIRQGESTPSSGVYDQPGTVLLTVDPAHRFAAAQARWRPA